LLLSVLDATQDTRWKAKESRDPFKDAAYDDAHEPERQQDKPDERVQDQRRYGEGPAGQQQKAEEDELDHELLLIQNTQAPP
jgi:hypothetical protein